ncbi:MAG TPA: hypothetical protein VME24_10925, partial [Alphaproteobacteria bacterium]|nr:hypothetical protein [Alphaproteobacteria bacterium]
MKTLIRKEVRVLLPTWAVAMLLAIAPAWLMGLFFPAQTAVIEFPAPFFVLPGLLLLAVSSFGQEFSAKTFSLLLTQPVVRNRAWRLKILTLALAFVVVLAAETISWGLFIQLHPKYSSHFLDAFPGLWLWTIALFTGGLWTTLLLRQEVGAFWITLLVPASILTGIGILGDYLNLSQAIEDRVGDLAVLIYSAAGFLFARRMFLHAQDTQWTGGNFFFWRRTTKEKAGSSGFRPARNRLLTLMSKEVQLHDANLFIAAIIFAANLGAVGLLPHVSNVNLKGALEFVWALWLLMPLLIGCAAVADERRLGVAEFQLCQPVSRQAAFSIKFFVALILSVVLGAVIPSVIEWTRNFGIMTWWDFWIFVAAPVIFFVSFYASTVSRSTVHAIGMAIAVSAAGCVAFFAFATALLHVIRSPIEGYDPSIGFGRLYMFIGHCTVIFPIVLSRLMFWNFRWLHQGGKLFWHNTAVILISFAAIFILTNLIYFRAWELLSPIEMPRGPVRLAAETPAKISAREDKIFALLPDGRVWEQGLDSRWLDFRSVDFYR